VTTATSPGPTAADTTPDGTRRYVRTFREGRATQKDLLGGKGANLAEMTYLGLPVPPGFTVTTDACRAYLAEGEVPTELDAEVASALAELEGQLGRRLGDTDQPLLLSVRSGAKFSMPGMMDTVLDLGAMPTTVPGLTAMTGDDWFAWDAVRRFAEMFGRVVLGVPAEVYDERVAAAVADAGVKDERSLDVADLERLARGHLDATADRGTPVPEDPHEQLRLAIEAVFRSWNGARAKAYRAMEGIPDDLGTAVNVQAMVFGNLGDRSATGVAFSRDPATGEDVPYGDWLMGAQGEDVVAGTRHVEPLATLDDTFPEAAEELRSYLDRLEAHTTEMADTEFTIEDGKLWMLQTRVGKRSAAAAVRIAVEMVDAGLIAPADALVRVTPDQLEQLLHPRFAEEPETPLTSGAAASPGAASGAIVVTAEEAVRRTHDGEDVILVRPETSPDDLEGMVASKGMVTSRGGLVSHAAVVARGLGKPAVVGCGDLEVDVAAGRVRVGDTVLHEGDVISLDGSAGLVVVGEVPLIEPEPDARLERLLGWADDVRTLHVHGNADTAEDVARAVAAGAQGIGLVRTEHQFLGARLPLVRAALLAETDEQEAAALVDLEAQQREDFVALLAAAEGRPVTVRLLDPPAHEFLPDLTELRIAAARGELDDDRQRLLEVVELHSEHDPMLGIRGVRLGIMRPALYRAQVRALLSASAELTAAGTPPMVEVMVPLVSTSGELRWFVELVHSVAAEVEETTGTAPVYRTATMIETPRAALTAGFLANFVDAFSFGTNDLTQLTFGLSRDDVQARFVPAALAAHTLASDPFRTLDEAGVARLVRMAVEDGTATNPELVTGICGEHGGDPASIAIAHRIGLFHVSCSPSRLPVARLAAAHAALEVEDAPGASS
jgi:pyruvate, orthophosphate dikinase